MFTPNEYGLFSMPTLETPRLTLRRMTMKDAKDVFEYSRDADVARHVLWSAQKDIGERISNVVLMGMGEPLDNYANTVKLSLIHI